SLKTGNGKQGKSPIIGQESEEKLMMKCELENLIGYEIPYAEYERVERVYMNIESLSKQSIADLYMKDKQLIIDISGYIASAESTVNELAERLSEPETVNEELQTQLHQYKVLFADIQRNATVDLYTALMGITP
ncbi:MAG: hypothetical protein OSJ72_21700, partial [Lachnospiraceae bacterium]|nr:hypothetical protein [Lachnospiraceae bacterium]